MNEPPHDAATHRPRARSGNVSAEVVGRDYVLHDAATGRVHFLNQTAALVWDLCDGSRTVAELGTEVARRYDLPVEAVQADVARVLAELAGNDLLVRPDGP